MATTEHFYTGNGSTTTYPFTFPYLKNADIKVSLDDVLKTETTHYTVSSTNIVFGSAPGSNVAIRIYRDTDVDTSKATFAAGSSIRAGDLNNNNTQLLYNAQEQKQLIRTAGIAAGQVTSAKVLANTIVDADVNSSAAIAGTKISPNFGSQAVSTTGTVATGALTTTGNIVVSGTVDGRDLAADGSKLDQIEGAATADQTESEIRLLVQNATDSNVFTDTYKTKLDGITAGANAYAISSDLLDEDNFASDSATKAASQQSIKAYVTANKGDANQNAFSNVAVSGQNTVAADGITDTLNIAAGNNITITTNDSTDTVTITGSGGEVTVQDEGSSLSTAATTLNFVGSGVVASGNGATKTITISGGGGGGAVTTDFQYLELKAHNNASGAFSAGSADYELVTKGTSTVESPSEAAALLISVAGVIQQPNTGTSIGSNEGFCIDGSSIHFGANLTAHPDFILYLKGAGSHTIADDSVAEVKLDISNTASDGQFLQYKDNTDKLTWASVTGTPEGTAVKSTGESGTAKFLRVDGDGTCSWQVPPDTNTTYSVQDGQLSQNNFTDADHTKLNAIEASATADQTDAEIRAAVEAATDSNVFTDADHTKLNAIAASANNYVHPNHSGEVTSTADGATVIADDVVDEANLKVSNSPTNGYVLTAQSGNTGGLTWAEASAGTITALNNQAANRLTTIGSTTTQLDGEASLTFEDTTSTGLISGKQITGRGFECPATVADDWTIAAGNNAMFPGPMTVASGKTITVPANRTLTVV